jgi:Fe-S cluster assembly iron-binding protein IscA
MNLMITDSAALEVKKFLEAEQVNGVGGLRVRAGSGWSFRISVCDEY